MEIGDDGMADRMTVTNSEGKGQTAQGWLLSVAEGACLGSNGSPLLADGTVAFWLYDRREWCFGC